MPAPHYTHVCLYISVSGSLHSTATNATVSTVAVSDTVKLTGGWARPRPGSALLMVSFESLYN